MKTKERLAAELEKQGCPPEMVSRAAAGYYDDFESPIATPCTQLVHDLRGLKKLELAERVISGEFDAPKEEADAWMEREGHALLRPDGQ